MEILKVQNKKYKKILKKKTVEFDFGTMERKEIYELIKQMRNKMRDSDGVGLSANQIGLNMQLFVAYFDQKFYAIFNPEVVKESKASTIFAEGCLSVPGEIVPVKRSEEISIKGFDKNGKRIKIKAHGFLARIFQHEIDHLNGKLITDYKK
jgi:peptide deformylase